MDGISSRFEEMLVLHCAPTLAGHKCGSLFSYRTPEGAMSGLAACARALRMRGVQVALFSPCHSGWLLSVHRPSMLNARLSSPDIRDFLCAMGYSDQSAWLETLRAHLKTQSVFPHEIGVFLDYPLSDVKSFIEHGGANYCCVGCWKCYHNPAAAQRTFALYRKCREVYMACYRRGLSISRLAVAA